MGKLESSPEVYRFSEHFLPWHAHITAVTVAPEARRTGIGRLLSRHVEVVADANNAWFVDLFVRSTNYKAIEFYKSMGYSIFRVVKEYYTEHSSDPSQPLRGRLRHAEADAERRQGGARAGGRREVRGRARRCLVKARFVFSSSSGARSVGTTGSAVRPEKTAAARPSVSVFFPALCAPLPYVQAPSTA